MGHPSPLKTRRARLLDLVEPQLAEEPSHDDRLSPRFGPIPLRPPTHARRPEILVRARELDEVQFPGLEFVGPDEALPERPTGRLEPCRRTRDAVTFHCAPSGYPAIRGRVPKG